MFPLHGDVSSHLCEKAVSERISGADGGPAAPQPRDKRVDVTARFPYHAAMPCTLRPLTDDQWSAISGLLRPLPQRSTRTDARLVFDTMLHMLWYGKPIRIMRKPAFASASVVSTCLWTWAENGSLVKAWRAYLTGTSALHLRHWTMVFTHYQESWQYRREAAKHAAKVHSLWFRILARGIQDELEHRKSLPHHIA